MMNFKQNILVTFLGWRENKNSIKVVNGAIEDGLIHESSYGNSAAFLS